MNVLHVITGLQKAAGTSTFSGEVCNQLAALGHDVTIAVLNPDSPSQYPLDSRVKFISINSLFANHQTLIAKPYTLVHIHGLWSPVLHKVSCWAHTHAIPIVWSTHGMTAPWALRHKWWKKALPWFLYQKWDLKKANLIHCTTDLELEWNRALGFKRCFIAPLGTSLPAKVEVGSRSRTVEDKVLLFVGRIYPVKALDRLIEAFARIDVSVRRNWVLRLVGPDQAGHMTELMALCDKLGLGYRNETSHCSTSTSDFDLVFAGPKFAQDLNAEYDNCDALALVSHTENFGATVIDALAHGKPVITSTKTPWQIVADSRCGWWVDNAVGPLSKALSELMALDDEARNEMGRRGRQLVEERFAWAAVGRAVGAAYEGLNASVAG